MNLNGPEEPETERERKREREEWRKSSWHEWREGTSVIDESHRRAREKERVVQPGVAQREERGRE